MNGEEKVEVIIDDILADPTLIEGGLQIMDLAFLC